MFALWYIYLGWEDFRRNHQLQWNPMEIFRRAPAPPVESPLPTPTDVQRPTTPSPPTKTKSLPTPESQTPKPQTPPETQGPPPKLPPLNLSQSPTTKPQSPTNSHGLSSKPQTPPISQTPTTPKSPQTPPISQNSTSTPQTPNNRQKSPPTPPAQVPARPMRKGHNLSTKQKLEFGETERENCESEREGGRRTEPEFKTEHLKGENLKEKRNEDVDVLDVTSKSSDVLASPAKPDSRTEDTVKDFTSAKSKETVKDVLSEEDEAEMRKGKKISFPDKEDAVGGEEEEEAAQESPPREDVPKPEPMDFRSVSDGPLEVSRSNLIFNNSQEQMRCWLTEGAHPKHAAGMDSSADNIKVITNRSRTSADSVLRDSDEFIAGEKHQVTRRPSWPKKVSISDEPPTTYQREVPPYDSSCDDLNEQKASPFTKMQREVELAAAAAAALKEDWRKRQLIDLGEMDDEDIIFGDNEEDADENEQRIVEISDDDDDDDEVNEATLNKANQDAETGQPENNKKKKNGSKMVDAAVLEKLEAGFKKLAESDSKSLLKKYLTQEVFDQLKTKKTPTFGSSLLDVIQSGLENHDSGVGIYAPDAEAYTVFSDLFDPIIEDYHGGFKKTDKHPPRDFGDVDCFANLDPAGEYIISTRVRCGRSMEGYPFNPCLTEAQYKEMEEKVSSTLSGLAGELKGNFYPLTGMTKEVQQKLIDDHFLFKEGDRFLQAANACRFWPTGRGIYHNDDKTFLVWCNEEDHLRIISMQMGGDLGQVYRRLVSAVNEIEKRVPFSHNDRLGFLTFCPTNLGTTIRASVHIKVPKLAANKAKLEEVAGKFNLQVRGTRGEHTEAEGGVYDISNKRRMGLTEFQAVKEMNDGIAELIKIEREL